jgi:hypothetical protein
MCGLFPRENPGLKPIQNRWTSFRGLKAPAPYAAAAFVEEDRSAPRMRNPNKIENNRGSFDSFALRTCSG